MDLPHTSLAVELANLLISDDRYPTEREYLAARIADRMNGDPAFAELVDTDMNAALDILIDEARSYLRRFGDAIVDEAGERLAPDR